MKYAIRCLILIGFLALVNCVFYGPPRIDYCRGMQEIKTSRLNAGISLSPDGSKLACIILGPDSGSTLYMCSSDGSSPKPLYVSLNRHVVFPGFAPSGDTVFFVISNWIFRLIPLTNDLDSIRCRRIIRAIAYPRFDNTIYYTYAEDSYVSAYSGPGSTGFNVYAVKTDGTNSKKITNFESPEISGLAPVSNGEYLYISGSVGEAYARRIHKIFLNSGIVVSSIEPGISIPKGLGTCYGLEASFDGTHLYYMAASEKSHASYFRHELFVLDIATQQIRQITDHGKRISYACDSRNTDKVYYQIDENWPCSRPSSYAIRWSSLKDATHGIVRIEGIDSLAQIPIDRITLNE